MMGKWSCSITGLLLVGVLALVPHPAVAASGDEAAIRQVMAAQQDGWNRGDVVAFMRGYKDSPDTTFIGAKVRKGFQAILDSYRKNYASAEQMGKLTFSEIDVRLLPGPDGDAHYAVATGRFHLERSLRGEAKKDDGVFSLVWERTSDGWKVILDHTS